MSRLRPSDVNYVIYHSPCSDGDGAARSAEHFFRLNGITGVTFHGTGHRKPIPKDLKGKRIVILDFSYPKDVLNQIIAEADDLLIIDHHVTAKDDLKDVPDRYKIFDMTHSGAYLAWDYFFPGTPVPTVIRHIEDRDIWLKKMSGTDDLAAYLFVHTLDYALFHSLLDESTLTQTIEKGKLYQEHNQFHVKKLAESATVRFMEIKGNHYFIVHCDCGIADLTSDLGNFLAKKFTKADFVAVYYINNFTDGSSFSLRSTDDQVDVSQVAKSLGGGGHRNASGAGTTHTTNHLPGLLIDNNNVFRILDRIYFGKFHGHNVVYLMSNYHKRRLGKYLLQNRRDNVQNCAAISTETARCSLAVTWDWDPIKNRSYYTITPDAGMSSEEVGRISELVGGDVNTAHFSLFGMYPQLREAFSLMIEE